MTIAIKLGALSAALLMATSARAVTIDFDDIASVPAGLAAVNAVTTPLGATFDAATSASFVVTGSVGSRTASANTLTGQADILVNFAFPVSSVSVVYADNTLAVGAQTVEITARDAVSTAAAVEGAGLTILDTDTGAEPVTLTVAAAGIRSLQIESTGTRVIIEQISFEAEVPLPASALLLLSGLGALALRRAV